MFYTKKPIVAFIDTVSTNILKIGIKRYAIALFSLWAIGTTAQITPNGKDKITYLLPDESVLEAEKLDSLSKAWGDGNMMFVHNETDDAKGIIRLMRMTDEMRQKMKSKNDDRKKASAAILNQPAPDFELSDLHGKKWSLKALRGKIVVLNFWFTSCAPCVKEIPQLNDLVHSQDKNEVVFLALTYNTAAQVTSFLQKLKFDYIQLPNSGEVDKKYGISQWPTSIVIDKVGKIRMVSNYNPKIHEELAAVIASLK